MISRMPPNATVSIVYRGTNPTTSLRTVWPAKALDGLAKRATNSRLRSSTWISLAPPSASAAILKRSVLASRRAFPW